MILIVFNDELINTNYQFDDEKFEIAGKRLYYMQSTTASFF